MMVNTERLAGYLKGGAVVAAFAAGVSFVGMQIVQGSRLAENKEAIPPEKAKCVAEINRDMMIYKAKITDEQGRLVAKFTPASNLFAPPNVGDASFPRGQYAGSRFEGSGTFEVKEEDGTCLIEANGQTREYVLASLSVK